MITATERKKSHFIIWFSHRLTQWRNANHDNSITDEDSSRFQGEGSLQSVGIETEIPAMLHFYTSHCHLNTDNHSLPFEICQELIK